MDSVIDSGATWKNRHWQLGLDLPVRPVLCRERKMAFVRVVGLSNRNLFSTLLASPPSKTCNHAERDWLSRTVHFTSPTPNHTGPINLLRCRPHGPISQYPVSSTTQIQTLSLTLARLQPLIQGCSPGHICSPNSKFSPTSSFFFRTPCVLRSPALPVTLYTRLPHLMVE